MLVHVAYSVLLVLGTVFVHATFTGAVLHWLYSMRRHHWAIRSAVTRTTVLGGIVFAMALAAYLEANLWALLYVGVGAVPELREAQYFSLVTFTTLGYGDVTLPEEWRLLGAFEAANGILLFGWTTALIVAAHQRLFANREEEGFGG